MSSTAANPYQTPHAPLASGEESAPEDRDLRWPLCGLHLAIIGWLCVGAAICLLILMRFTSPSIREGTMIAISLGILSLVPLLHAGAGVCWGMTPSRDGLRWWGIGSFLALAATLAGSLFSTFRWPEFVPAVAASGIACAYFAQLGVLRLAALRLGREMPATASVVIQMLWVAVALGSIVATLFLRGILLPLPAVWEGFLSAALGFAVTLAIIGSMILTALVRRAVLDQLPDSDPLAL